MKNNFMNNEDFYELITEIRHILKNSENLKCTCPNTFCEWHGKCKECVALHRYYGNHIPTCMQPIMKNKVRLLADAVELNVEEKQRSTIEHWQYVKERDNAGN